MSIRRKFINPKSLGEESAVYSQGIFVSLAQSSKLLFIAGQVAMDSRGKVIGKRNIESQTNYIMEKLKNILAGAEMDFSDVVKTNLYLVNIDDDLPKIINVRKYYFQANRPAATAIGVKKLVHPDLLIEIEMIAIK